MSVIKHLEELIAKHHPHVSGLTLAVAFIATVGLITPAMLLAEGLPPGGPDFRPEPRLIQRGDARPPEPPRFDASSTGPNGELKGMPENIREELLKKFGSSTPPGFPPQMLPPGTNDKKNTEDLKRGLLNLKPGFDKFKQQLQELKNKGLPLPPEVTSSTKNIEAIFNKINRASSIKDIQNAGTQNIVAQTEIIKKFGKDLQKIADYPGIIKNAKQEFNTVKGFYNQDVKIVAEQATKGLDLSSELASLKASLDDAQGYLKSALSVATSTPAVATDIIKNNFAPKLNEARAADQAIKILANPSRFISEYKSGVAQANKLMQALESKKVDTTKLAPLLDSLKQAGDALVAQISSATPDQGALTNAVKTFTAARVAWQTASAEALKAISGQQKPLIDFEVMRGLVGPSSTSESK